jgi:hypothetical protein
VANRDARERRNGAVALAPACTGRSTVDGGRGRRGRSQQGSHSSFVGEDAREPLDASMGGGATLEHVEGLGPSRRGIDHLRSRSNLRTRKRGRGGDCEQVGWDGGAIEGKKSDKIEGDEGFPGGRDDKLRLRRSGVDYCCDVNIKRSETLRAWVEKAVGGEDVNELERVELSNECEFSLEGVCHSNEPSVVLDVGHGGGDGGDGGDGSSGSGSS